MSQNVDLNQVRALVLRNQDQGRDLPARQADKLLVDPQGKIRRGADVTPGEERNLSEVHQSTFSSGLLGRITETQIVARKFPAGTRELNVGGVRGWLYRLTSELGDQFTMFTYHDGQQYQVKVVSPEVEGRYSQHEAHLFNDGRICFDRNGGLSTLEQAYAKSVLWATGFSFVLRGQAFPFSNNNV